MSIRIIKQGLFDTIQDNGRYGYQHLGINTGGVMDVIAASVANMLVGNDVNEPVIELHFPAASIFFEKPCMIALSGADFSATINDEIIPLNTVVIVAASSTLLFKKYKTGARCYLAISGGFKIGKWLGSYSTNIKAKAGGFKGRVLQKNDVIDFNKKQQIFNQLPEASFITTSIRVVTSSLYNSSNVINCIKGSQYEWLDDAAKNNFITEPFIISNQSDRMGYRLTGKTLHTTEKKQMLSSAVTHGAVQLLPDGGLILLIADHQTTGGYPVIANVISADMPALAQMQPGAALHFSYITIDEAETLYMQQQQNLQQLQDACNFQLRQFFSANDFN